MCVMFTFHLSAVVFLLPSPGQNLPWGRVKLYPEHFRPIQHSQLVRYLNIDAPPTSFLYSL